MEIRFSFQHILSTHLYCRSIRLRYVRTVAGSQEYWLNDVKWIINGENSWPFRTKLKLNWLLHEPHIPTFTIQPKPLETEIVLYEAKSEKNMFQFASNKIDFRKLLFGFILVILFCFINWQMAPSTVDINHAVSIRHKRKKRNKIVDQRTSAINCPYVPSVYTNMDIWTITTICDKKKEKRKRELLSWLQPKIGKTTHTHAVSSIEFINLFESMLIICNNNDRKLPCPKTSSARERETNNIQHHLRVYVSCSLILILLHTRNGPFPMLNEFRNF